MLKQLRSAAVVLLVFGVLTGILYPLSITGLSQLIFPSQANGSLIEKNGQAVGSVLIGQEFTDPHYFWGRLSDTSGEPYNASASGGSNYSVMNPSLQNQVQARIKALQQADPGNTQPIPVDLVTASASGLDPDISIAAAEYQAPRIARLRGLSLEEVTALIRQNTRSRILGFLGERVINVLEINLALDALK